MTSKQSHAATLAKAFDPGSAAPEHFSLVSVYTTEDAVDDGVLVDAQQGDFEDVTKQHYGSTPVYMTRALFHLIKTAVENKRTYNDFRGVWHDVCSMSTASLRNARACDRKSFKVIITGCGRQRLHTLIVVWDGQSVTYMMPDED